MMNSFPLIPWLSVSPWRMAILIVAIIVVGFTAYSSFEARFVRVRNDEIVSDRVPKGLDGTRVVFLADIHAGRFLGRRGMDELVAKVNALEPDVLVLGGDYVGGKARGASTFYGAAPGFEARLGKLAVLGNHDVWEGAREARDGLAASGFTLLENSSARIGSGSESITVAGVDDLYTGTPDVSAAASQIPAQEFAILVSHNPDVFGTQLADSPRIWDLALAGHTHAGQLTALGFAAPFVPSRFGQRYRAGWLTEEGTPILVTPGVGVVTLPLRFFARPEIHVITLRRP